MNNINLLPWRTKQKYQRMSYWGLAWTITILIHLVLWKYFITAHTRCLSASEQALRVLDQNKKPALTREQRRQMNRIKLWAPEYHHTHDIPTILSHIAASIPHHAKLTKIQYQTHRYILSGIARQAKPIFTMLEALQTVKLFKSTQLISLKHDEAMHFVIQITLVH